MVKLLDVEYYRDLEMWVRGHSRPLKLVPFESLGAVSYSPSIVTMAISVAVCEIFSVKEWHDLENQVRGRSRSLKMALVDRSYAAFYWSAIVNIAQCRQFQEDAKDASVSECTWTLSALEALHNALYKFRTSLLTYLLTLSCTIFEFFDFE